jgi:eukaryotic-like serine/threonine-protein kinase
VESGTVLAGRYRLDRRLGHGGMGEVWSGRDLRLGRDVAVKALHDADPGEAEVRRFIREATVAAGLQHPGITVIFDAGAHDGRLFLVTELLSGKDLGKVLALHPGGLPLDQVLDFGIQLADALSAAHGRGIIHRDLKPTNLFVQADGRPPGGRLKVCDFGLARALASSSKVIRAGEAFGTPAYMAPEQWRNPAASPSTDLYAAGCILYEMVTGRVPFEGPSLPALMTQHLTQPPVPPRAMKPGVPAVLNDLVLSLLSKEAADRPASATEVLAILSLLRDAPQHATTSARTPETQVRPRLTRTLTGHTENVHSVAFSPDSTLLATGGYDGTVRLWDTTTGQTSHTLTFGTSLLGGVAVSSLLGGVAFSPGGTLLAIGIDKTVRLWDTTTGRTIRTLTGHTDFVLAVAFSPDGTLATGSRDKTARLWETTTGQAIRTLADHTSSVYGVGFSPDGTLLATRGVYAGSSDKTVWLWDTATGQAIRTLTGPTGDVSGMAFSPDGALLATSSEDGTARLWDTATGQTIRTLTGHASNLRGVAFSPDGTLLATASYDKTVRLWDTTSGQAIHTVTGHTGWVLAVAFSPDGTLLATVGDDQTARLWVLG